MQVRNFLFCIPAQTGPGAQTGTSAMGIGAFPRGKAAGLGVEQPPTTSARVNYVLLYLYYPSVPVMACYRALEELGMFREFWSLCIL